MYGAAGANPLKDMPSLMHPRRPIALLPSQPGHRRGDQPLFVAMAKAPAPVPAVLQPLRGLHGGARARAGTGAIHSWPATSDIDNAHTPQPGPR